MWMEAEYWDITWMEADAKRCFVRSFLPSFGHHITRAAEMNSSMDLHIPQHLATNFMPLVRSQEKNKIFHIIDFIPLIHSQGSSITQPRNKKERIRVCGPNKKSMEHFYSLHMFFPHCSPKETGIRILFIHIHIHIHLSWSDPCSIK